MTRQPRKRVLFAHLALLSTAAVLTACSDDTSDSRAHQNREFSYVPESTMTPNTRFTLESAKAFAMSIEDRAAGAVPTEFISNTTQLQAVPLLSCDGDNMFTWPGHTNVVLQGSYEPQDLIERIKAVWKGEPGYTAEMTTRINNQLGLEIDSPEGATLFADFSQNNSVIVIASFSPCFHLPDGNNGDDY